MDIENMKAFNKVAELKSISAAANELHHLQSNMSNKIKNIEKQFQTQLFFRHSNGVELTKEGEKIYQQFKKMILLWEETIDIINNEEETISIGITQSSLPMEFNTIIKKFYQQFPNKKLSIVSGSTSELIPKIANRELTIAYVAELEKENLFQDSQIISQTLSWDKLVFAGNTAGKSVQKILAEERLYVFSKQCYSYRALATLINDFNIPNVSISEINIPETLVEICNNKLGVGIIPESIALNYHFLNYETLPTEYAALRKTLIYHADHTISNGEKWLIEKSKPAFKS
ncbi:LysR family transcriptional regulator [Listeria monocytogenes]|jgi:transcriptional regulator, LysR family|uniref:Lmo0294 protein n=2 Tax=Listeria monocytogenes TaxID=1639 RepID=Q8YA65_LISMO|nr:LysR family transcriptional regulator [Listeria monocytogenes]NP_463825.1 LysR family transcriptional regulator [Listeria monocytogenes EGD-e]EAD3236156.1 LysR family transcriptional regulator [Listeria monocytogenes CFSAN002202]EAD5037496.1 LysR family transcriptional regulator [Listeria monocytogenes serotype 1/2a]EAE3703647.1 LysR family transcriptional regulator [Listeria monocytogenes serotype 1/2c]EAG9424807.1 LysR family transcriptional regulator [Listeria monocytogenes CFSAN002184]